MGLVTPLVNLTRRLGRHHSVITFARLVIVPVDKVVARLTKGRLVTFRLKELPTMLLTTTGRRSGQSRTVPILYLPYGEEFVVAGSNFGQAHHPAWSANLMANPEASVNVRGRTIAVRAHLAEGDERVRLMTELQQLWPAFGSYEEWSNRTLRIFRLTPTS
jgi:deazaflavin-dependent oxidoreductase (nitroreductase family)